MPRENKCEAEPKPISPEDEAFLKQLAETEANAEVKKLDMGSILGEVLKDMQYSEEGVPGYGGVL